MRLALILLVLLLCGCNEDPAAGDIYTPPREPIDKSIVPDEAHELAEGLVLASFPDGYPKEHLVFVNAFYSMQGPIYAFRYRYNFSGADYGAHLEDGQAYLQFWLAMNGSVTEPTLLGTRQSLIDCRQEPKRCPPFSVSLTEAQRIANEALSGMGENVTLTFRHQGKGEPSGEDIRESDYRGFAYVVKYGCMCEGARKDRPCCNELRIHPQSGEYAIDKL